MLEIRLPKEVESGPHHRKVANEELVGTNFRSDGTDIKGNNFAYGNSGFWGIDDYGRGIHSFYGLRVILHETCKVPSVC